LQQPLMGEFEHVWTDRSHASSVQTSPSAHWGFVVQQPAMVGWLHVRVRSSHRSCVHGLVSAQSPSLRQQPAIAAFEQTPVPTLQVSAVQTSESLQSVLAPQQPATGRVAARVRGGVARVGRADVAIAAISGRVAAPGDHVVLAGVREKIAAVDGAHVAVGARRIGRAAARYGRVRAGVRVAEQTSDVHASPSPQSASVRQQAATVVKLHLPLARQVSSVHGSPVVAVAHRRAAVVDGRVVARVRRRVARVGRASGGVGALAVVEATVDDRRCPHVCDARSHTSRVHVTPSSHCESFVQQPGSRTFEQLCCARQTSTVQMSPSKQSPPFWQHAACGRFWQTPLSVMQLSIGARVLVIALAVARAAPGDGRVQHLPWLTLQESCVHAVPSLQSLSCVQHPDTSRLRHV
jgi:hypothetical protein